METFTTELKTRDTALLNNYYIQLTVPRVGFNKYIPVKSEFGENDILTQKIVQTNKIVTQIQYPINAAVYIPSKIRYTKWKH